MDRKEPTIIPVWRRLWWRPSQLTFGRSVQVPLKRASFQPATGWLLSHATQSEQLNTDIVHIPPLLPFRLVAKIADHDIYIILFAPIDIPQQKTLSRDDAFVR